jgi:uncharacterized small protein (DUF1192 family)
MRWSNIIRSRAATVLSVVNPRISPRAPVSAILCRLIEGQPTSRDKCAMDWDELKPKPKASIVIGEDLRTLSVADLRERITACEAEIARLAKEIGAREAHEAAASRLFKK